MLNWPRYFVLDDDNNPLPVDDVLVWAQWFETNRQRKRVALTQVGPYQVSTVFLGLDHNYFDDGDPLIYETMVFAADGQLTLERSMDLDCHRYSTRQEAVEGHQVTCDLVALEVERQGGVKPAMTDVPRP